MFRFNIWFFGWPHSFRAPPKCYQASSDIFVQPPFLAFAKLLLQLMLNNMIHQTSPLKNITIMRKVYTPSLYYIISTVYLLCINTVVNWSANTCPQLSMLQTPSHTWPDTVPPTTRTSPRAPWFKLLMCCLYGCDWWMITLITSIRWCLKLSIGQDVLHRASLGCKVART